MCNDGMIRCLFYGNSRRIVTVKSHTPKRNLARERLRLAKMKASVIEQTDFSGAREWTMSEELDLVRNWLDFTLAEFAVLLNRSYDSVKRKAERLKLRKVTPLNPVSVAKAKREHAESLAL